MTKFFVLSLVFFCLLGFVVSQNPRGCRYILGKCQSECEEGTHAYTTGCSRKMPEATCENPNPQLEEGILCDYSACYCDAPTVRNEDGKCVKLEDCPKTPKAEPCVEDQ